VKYLVLFICLASGQAMALSFDELAAESARQNQLCSQPGADDTSSATHLGCIIETHKLADMQQAFAIQRDQASLTQDAPPVSPGKAFEACVLDGNTTAYCKLRYY
jgi:hypothetical protein